MGCPLVTDAMTEDTSVLFPVEGSPMKALNWLLTSRFVARNTGALATTSSALMTSATGDDWIAQGLVLAMISSAAIASAAIFFSNSSVGVNMKCPFLLSLLEILL